MKRLLRLLMVCMALLAMSAALPGACAQGEAGMAVVIGDGAPIPYLEGFESRLVHNAELIQGITGAFAQAQVSQRSDLQVAGQSDAGTWTYELQNLVLTDDVLGLFFKQTYSEPIVYGGDIPYSYGVAAMMPEILVDGETLKMLNQFKEGYPIDAYSQYSFVLQSLPEPVKDGQVLTFGAQWNDDLQAWEGGLSVLVDRSRADDPTIVYQPSLTVQETLALWEGNKPIPYNFTVERVSFTPFGNRVLLRFTGTCESNQYLDCQLLDDAGAALNIIPTMQRFYTNASAEHPVVNENEVWFFGGEGSRSLTLVPLGGNWQTSNKARRTAPVALDSLPADIPLENGVVLRAESCELSDNGFYVRYSTDGYAGYVSFDLGDADGISLGFPFASYLLDDHAQALLGSGAYWCEEYKGNTVSRVFAGAAVTGENPAGGLHGRVSRADGRPGDTNRAGGIILRRQTEPLEARCKWLPAALCIPSLSFVYLCLPLLNNDEQPN